MSKDTKKATQSLKYKRWYAENKLALSAKRKAKYHSDNEYREALLSKKRASTEGYPEGTIPFKEAGELLGMTSYTLSVWESEGVIPPVPRLSNGFKYLTKTQIELVRAIKAYRKRGANSPRHYSAELSTALDNAVRRWND
jgi:hypothetical protein